MKNASTLFGLLLAAACGAEEPISYVAPWNGPPSDFSGQWDSFDVRDQTGARVSGVAGIAMAQVSPTSLSAGYLSTPAHRGDCGGHDFLITTGFDATITADGHGFDGVVKMGGADVPIHGRMDTAQGLHVEFDTKGNLPYCTKSYAFIATLSARLGPTAPTDAGSGGD
jgi:hypothetical protein